MHDGRHGLVRGCVPCHRAAAALPSSACLYRSALLPRPIPATLTHQVGFQYIFGSLTGTAPTGERVLGQTYMLPRRLALGEQQQAAPRNGALPSLRPDDYASLSVALCRDTLSFSWDQCGDSTERNTVLG